MSTLNFLCTQDPDDSLTITGDDGELHFAARQDGQVSSVYLSAEDEARLLQLLIERRGITPSEPVALTRIAVASERAAVALEKLASYATEDPLADSARIP